MYELKMRENCTKGYLITFCGLDGSGKSTIINCVINELKNKFSIFLTKQPTDAVRQSMIFRTFMDTPNHQEYDYRSLSLLAASDRLQHVNKVIEPELERGKVVISDRYFYSCLANLHARGFEKDKWIYDVAQHVIKPDIAFFFDVPVDMAIRRVRSRENEKNRFIDVELQEKLRHEYKKICEANGGVIVPTDSSLEETFEIVKKHLDKELLKNARACV